MNSFFSFFFCSPHFKATVPFCWMNLACADRQSLSVQRGAEVCMYPLDLPTVMFQKSRTSEVNRLIADLRPYSYEKIRNLLSPNLFPLNEKKDFKILSLFKAISLISQGSERYIFIWDKCKKMISKTPKTENRFWQSL